MLFLRMESKVLARLGLVALTMSLSSIICAETFNDPCGGPSALLSIVNRPTVGDSACAVPYQSTVIETGYQYMSLINSLGSSYNLPQALVRVGLPKRSEFVVLLPNYYHLSLNNTSGASAVTVGLKHELGYNAKWLWTVEALLTPPSGSAMFGSQGLGVAANGIVNYSFNSKVNASFMFGISTLTMPGYFGGRRYTSFNPLLVLSYTPLPVLSMYAEFYGATKAAAGLGGGSNMDVGILYLVTPKIEIDAAVGQRLGGVLTGFEHYVGVGASFMF